ncbi:MAG: YceD family protein [Microbacteriaceae bacterium]
MKSHPTAPFTVSVFDVSHRIGEERDVHLDETLAERWGEGVAYIDKGHTVEIDLRLEGLHDGILVSADIDTTATAECVRCLEEVSIPVQVEFQELFAYSPTEELEFSVHDNHVNCEQLVRDAVVLSLPFQPLCDEDCLGLDPETGEKLMEPRTQDANTIDPRWAALEALASPEKTTANKPAAKKRT